jgi:hypothetical protein
LSKVNTDSTQALDDLSTDKIKIAQADFGLNRKKSESAQGKKIPEQRGQHPKMLRPETWRPIISKAPAAKLLS